MHRHQFPQRNTTRYQSRGFSLVELMVSLSIFSMVMLISTGTLLVMININAKAQALSSSSTNLSFVLDNMTRELRTGYHYYCDSSLNYNEDELPPDTGADGDCSGGDEDLIAFTREWDNHRMGYRLNNNAIEFREEDEDGNEVTEWTPITSNNITVETFDIVVLGSEAFYAGSDDTTQAVIDIAITGEATGNNGLDTPTDFNIQTHMVPHRLDIQ